MSEKVRVGEGDGQDETNVRTAQEEGQSHALAMAYRRAGMNAPTSIDLATNAAASGKRGNGPVPRGND